VVQEILDFSKGIEQESDRTAFEALTNELMQAALPYSMSHASGVPGSERVMRSFLDIIREWVVVERWFCDGKSYADAVDGLRKAKKDDYEGVLKACRAHSRLAATASIISMIITMIGDASRIDSATSITSPIGKRASILTGAESLSEASPRLSEVGAMKGLDEYIEVALKARKLLLQESMPSFEERKRKFEDATKKLATAEASRAEIEDMVEEQLPIGDVLFPLIKGFQNQEEEIAFMELCIRYLYRPYTLNDFTREAENRLLTFSFQNKPSESALSAGVRISSTTELTRMVSSNNSLDKRLIERSDSDSSFLQTDNKEKISPSTVRTGVVMLVDSLEDLNDASKFELALSKFSPSGENDDSSPVNVMYIFTMAEVLRTNNEEMDSKAVECKNYLKEYAGAMVAAGVRRVTILFEREHDEEFKDHSVPASFTFRYPEFDEEELFRNIEPSHVYHLELHRVARNFYVKSLGRQTTTTCHVHLYQATPRTSALAQDKSANKAPRVFARAISFTLDFSSSSFERVLVDALNAIDVVALKSKSDNHLFINLEGHLEKVVLDPVVVEQVVVDIMKRHGSRITGLGIVEVETRVVCRLSTDSPSIALRLVASNPTGYVHVMSTYVEAADENEGHLVFTLIGGTKASLASSGDSSWEGMSVNAPYPLTRPFDAQRKAAMLSSDTLYCYDLPALFEAAVEQQWTDMAGRDQNMITAGRPLMVMYTSELVVQKKGLTPTDNWTMADYLAGDLELVQANRGSGANDVGMVAWLMVLKTVEYPEGRQVILVANDITLKAGSFGTREDVVFKLASEYAREHRIPRLFVAANSGARIGLAERVRKTFSVAFKDPSKPENGFDFIYVSKENYQLLTEFKDEIIATEDTYKGESVYRITSIIGSEPDLGVENLKGSGLIAGETSAAYQDIFTLTIVLGRTVGIGAYLVRLGQRTIQKASASPIILTGYQALNKLMGVNVYSTNDQLGGPGIMYPNGISHIVEPDHLRAIKAAIDWLSYVPSRRGGILPITDIRGVDDIERLIGFTPSPGVPYDPRHLLAGTEDDAGMWQSGFFDKGSFTEYLAGWAKTVIIGRARLGGIPMGVVITENRTAEAIKPADPADVKASEAVIQEAGCVWFPNSAYKTAQAINDFRSEDLPLMVFANWRGFSGGQRDMFDEVLKYGSLIVDAFVAYTQPVFVFIPPYAEIRGGAWVVLDASINSGSMEMYASAGTARGGVLEANGAASVKYRTKDLLVTMHRIDDQLQDLEKKIGVEADPVEKELLQARMLERERVLLPVYEQIAVQFCDLHDTPTRMKAVGVIEREVEWKQARSFFYWRLRRKLAEFDLRGKVIEAAEVGRGVKTPTPLEASRLIREWFTESHGNESWNDDKMVLSWMAHHHHILEEKILAFTKSCVAEEVLQVLTAGGNTARVGAAGIVEGLAKACAAMSPNEKEQFKNAVLNALQ
jgi:acetyl-CoA carboxylase/biotin carboxylase 1